MYTVTNFKSKKALRDAVASGQRVSYWQPNADLTGATVPQSGQIAIEGPHFPEPHRWYAACTAKDGVIVKVK